MKGVIFGVLFLIFPSELKITGNPLKLSHFLAGLDLPLYWSFAVSPSPVTPKSLCHSLPISWRNVQRHSCWGHGGCFSESSPHFLSLAVASRKPEATWEAQKETTGSGWLWEVSGKGHCWSGHRDCDTPAPTSSPRQRPLCLGWQGWGADTVWGRLPRAERSLEGRTQLDLEL